MEGASGLTEIFARALNACDPPPQPPLETTELPLQPPVSPPSRPWRYVAALLMALVAAMVWLFRSRIFRKDEGKYEHSIERRQRKVHFNFKDAKRDAPRPSAAGQRPRRVDEEEEEDEEDENFVEV